MNFKDSVFENKLNAYWNKYVVTLDEQIRTHSLGFGFLDVSADQLISLYYKHVQYILSNLDNKTSMFLDASYIQEYKESTIRQTLEDFNFYASIFPEYKNAISDLSLTLSPNVHENMEFLHFS